MSYQREALATFTSTANQTHYYEVVYFQSENLDWFQIA